MAEIKLENLVCLSLIDILIRKLMENSNIFVCLGYQYIMVICCMSSEIDCRELVAIKERNVL